MWVHVVQGKGEVLDFTIGFLIAYSSKRAAWSTCILELRGAWASASRAGVVRGVVSKRRCVLNSTSIPPGTFAVVIKPPQRDFRTGEEFRSDFG